MSFDEDIFISQPSLLLYIRYAFMIAGAVCHENKEPGRPKL